VEPVVEIWGFRKRKFNFLANEGHLKKKKFIKILGMRQNHFFQVAKTQKLVPKKKTTTTVELVTMGFLFSNF
jgi:hypothetical protein